jgi:hypothetical protein
VSLFGNGDGECIVMHLGDERWLVVDSFRDESGTPVALAYLDALRVSRRAIRLVAATHYHSDHVAGLSDVLAASPRARLITSSAIGDRRFLEAIDSAGPPRVPETLSAPLAEFYALLKVVERRRILPEPVYAANSRTELWPEDLETRWPTKVRSLSPTTKVALRAVARIARQELPGSPVRSPDQNAISIVLWIVVGERSILLGADLPRGRGPTGWAAILAANVARGRLSDYFKVPHHGSTGAHHPEVSERLIHPEAVATLTTKRASGLPRGPGLASLRVSHRTCYIAGTEEPDTAFADDEWALINAFAEVEVLSGNVGHVRARRKIVGPGMWEVTRNQFTRRLC